MAAAQLVGMIIHEPSAFESITNDQLTGVTGGFDLGGILSKAKSVMGIAEQVMGLFGKHKKKGKSKGGQAPAEAGEGGDPGDGGDAG